MVDVRSHSQEGACIGKRALACAHWHESAHERSWDRNDRLHLWRLRVQFVLSRWENDFDYRSDWSSDLRRRRAEAANICEDTNRGG